MTHEDFRDIEQVVASGHADMAAQLGISEVSVKRYATSAQPIPAHVARLAVALLLMKREDLEKKYGKLLARYHRDTHN